MKRIMMATILRFTNPVRFFVDVFDYSNVGLNEREHGRNVTWFKDFVKEMIAERRD